MANSSVEGKEDSSKHDFIQAYSSIIDSLAPSTSEIREQRKASIASFLLSPDFEANLD